MSKKLNIISIFLIIIPYISTFSMEDVANLSYTFDSSRIDEMFWAPSQNPIAPKKDGGYYLCYREKSNFLHVAEFDNSDKLIKNQNLTYQAIPFDIVETDNGFAIYARNANDEHHSFLLIYTSKYELINETTLMNSGDQPNRTIEGVTFYNNDGVGIFGLERMYRPTTAKLAYGNNRINLIFAHYNYFDSDNGGHSGDTYYSFDANGTNAKYAWNWVTSHSLIQAHMFDGKYFVTASLGDCYPMGFSIAFIDCSVIDDARDTIDYKMNQDIVKSFPGNMGGNSMGRLGGIMKFEDYYVIVYSVKKNENEVRDGIYLTKFKFDGDTITALSTAEIIKDVAGKLKNLRAAKYGEKRILITYIHNQDDYGNGYPTYYQDMNEKMYYIVCDTEGVLKTGPLEASWTHQTLNEDIRPLKDGSLRWGYIDVKNVLRITKILITEDADGVGEEDSGEVSRVNVLLVLFIIFFIF